MGDTNTKRLEHNLDVAPNAFRSRQLDQILNDLGEEDTGKGFSEIIRTGAFVSSLITWEDNSKTKKRSEATFNRTGPFTDSIVKEVFDEDTGLIVKATITTIFTRDSSQFVLDADVTVTRP